jgi:hypothetical protein
MDNGYIFKKKIKERKKEERRSWGLFRIYQLINTANPALFEWSWAWLAALIGCADYVVYPKRPPGFFSLFY